MRKIIFTLCLSFITIALIGQSESTVHFGFHLNANLSKLVFADSEVIEVSGGSSAGIGADMYFDVNEKLQIKSSLIYSRQTFNQKDYSLIFACDLSPFGPGDQKSFIIDEYTIHYLGLGLEVRAKLVGSTNHLYAKGGLNVLFRTAFVNSVSLVECGLPARPLSLNPRGVPRNFLPEVKGGIGYEWSMGKKIKMYFEPQARISIVPVLALDGLIQSDNYYPHALNMGIIAGLRF